MADYLTFSEVADLLPSGLSAGSPQNAFSVSNTSGPFIEPMMRAYDVAPQPQVTFISARGATGKSAMAAELSHRLAAPLWALGDDKAVSGDALSARLAAYLGAVDPLGAARAGQFPILILDAVDEARLRVTGVSWDEFMESLVQYSSAGVHLVILGRKRTVEDVWYALAEASVDISWYEISHFNDEQQSQYVDLRALGASNDGATEAYRHAKEVVLADLNGATDQVLDEAFAGYAPVLDAVAALLTPGTNYQSIVNDFERSAAAGTRLAILRRILEALLLREQRKVVPLARELGLDESRVYSPHEQIDWLGAELLGLSAPAIGWCPESHRPQYVERLAPFIHDHPFREADSWASPVFSSYVGKMKFDLVDGAMLRGIAGTSGLLFEFVATDRDSGPVILDEMQFAALHASLMAGQWTSSTSVVSLRSNEDGNDLPESVSAEFVLLQPDGASASLAATVVTERPGVLQLASPLAFLEAEFAGSIVVRATGTSIDLGPEVFLRARVIELLGASLQVSRDSSTGEATGPTVEMELSEGFSAHASLLGHVATSDLSIVAPSDVKLTYPWITFRAEPEEEDSTRDANVKARRLLNKLMSLTRRHGHRGASAVFVKKLEGRQGLPTQDFQHALAVLSSLGVVHLEGEMLYINDPWDQHRFDGKGRDGMVSYEDQSEVWDPVVRSISEAIGD